MLCCGLSGQLWKAPWGVQGYCCRAAWYLPHGGAAPLTWLIQGEHGMCNAGARGKTPLEADSVDDNLTAPLVLLIMDHNETFRVSMAFIVNMMNLGEGRCSLKHLHVSHKHTCRGKPRSNHPAYPFASQNRWPGLLWVRLLPYWNAASNLFCKIQKMLRNLGCSVLWGVKLQRACLVSVSKISVEAC